MAKVDYSHQVRCTKCCITITLPSEFTRDSLKRKGIVLTKKGRMYHKCGTMLRRHSRDIPRSRKNGLERQVDNDAVS